MRRYIAVLLYITALTGCTMLDLPDKFKAENKKGTKTRAAIVKLQDVVLEEEKTLQSHWSANSDESNVDYTPSPPDAGDVILAKTSTGFLVESYTTGGDSWFVLEPFGLGNAAAQGFKVSQFGLTISGIEVYVKNTGANDFLYGSILTDSSGTPGSQLGNAANVSVASAFEGWKTLDFSGQGLILTPDTQYYIQLYYPPGSGSPLNLRFDNGDATYPNGSKWTKLGGNWGEDTGDDYLFKVSLFVYETSGYITTDNFDIGQVPVTPGEWQVQDIKPDGTTLSYEAWSSSTGLYDVDVPLMNNQGNTIGNLAWNSTPGVTVWNQNWQSFQHSSYQTGKLGEVSGRFFKNFAGTRTIYCELWSASKGALIGAAVSASLTAAGVNQDLTFDFFGQDLDVEADTEYWVKFYDGAAISNDAYFVAQRYETSDVFLAGQFDRTGALPGTNLGDLRFTIIVKVWGNYLGPFQDGDSITTLTEYYRARADFTANTARDKTPTLQSIKADFSTYIDVIAHAAPGSLSGLQSIGTLSTEISDFKPTTISSMTITFPFNKRISAWFASRYPKNRIAKVKYGFIAPGFTAADYIDRFYGQIEDWKISSSGSVTVTIYSFHKEWKTEIPEKWETALDDQEWIEEHPVNVILDILQNFLTVRDSKINYDSFYAVRDALPGWEVTRKITENTEEAKEMMEQLRSLMTCYFTLHGDGSVGLKRWDANETPVASLSDKDFLPPGPSWAANAKGLKNEVFIYFAHGEDGAGNYTTPTAGDEEVNFRALATDFDGDSIDNWQETAPKVLKDKWTRSTEDAQVTTRVAGILGRYKDPRSLLSVSLSGKWIALETGDILNITTKRYPSTDFTGCTDKPFQIVKTTPNWLKKSGAEINLVLLEV